MPLVIVVASVVSLLAAAMLYGGWTVYQSRYALREWRQRSERAEQQVASLERHLGALVKVIHHKGGGVVQRYYEISALRFLLMKQHPSAWDPRSSIPQWLRAHSEFLHDLAEQSRRVGTTEEMRRRIEAVRIGHGEELASYTLPVDVDPPTASSPTEDSVHDSALVAEAERQALFYFLQVATALAFSGRFVSAEHGGRGSALAGVEHMCDEAAKILHGQTAAVADRALAVVAAADALSETLGTAWLAGAAAAKPTPSKRQLDDLKTSVRGAIGGGSGAAGSASYGTIGSIA